MVSTRCRSTGHDTKVTRDPRVDAYLRKRAATRRRDPVDTCEPVEPPEPSAAEAFEAVEIVPLTGDASDRRYFRLLSPGGSRVVALHAGPIDFRSLPFANVAELMQAMDMPVPGILDHSDDEGVLLLEDLGDVTLQAHLATAVPAERIALYREAVSLIERLQRRGQEFAGDRYLPYALAFDVEKLRWELDFFVTHFLEGHRQIALSSEEREALAAEWTAIASELSAEPRVLCHRDYHSRNLMLHRGRLHIIDFQDARLGPDTYDLVSLLRDSYVDIAEQAVADLIAHFLALKRRGGNATGGGGEDAAGGAGDAAEFRRRFDLMAVQRNLKALGTFGCQASARGNPSYIQYMPRTLAYVRSNLERYDRFARLRSLLSRHVEELR
jgi:aminoglycoside/choline kinase family phosphotransferase